jgi:hypothetical protein
MQKRIMANKVEEKDFFQLSPGYGDQTALKNFCNKIKA